MTYDDYALTTDFQVGDRVETHPATDYWMMGARFGTVIKIGRKMVHVQLDRIDRVRTIHPRNLRVS
jgi:hypothetical protein